MVWVSALSHGRQRLQQRRGQPFYVNAPFGLVLVLVQSGNLTSANALKQELFHTDHRHINTESDSEVLFNMLAHELEKVTRDITLKRADVFNAVGGVQQLVRARPGCDPR